MVLSDIAIAFPSKGYSAGPHASVGGGWIEERPARPASRGTS